MSLQHALLVSLAEREATGYELTRRFDRSVGFFWSATHQQIYRVLGRMADDGLVAVRTEPGEGRPDRRVYSLAQPGRAELRRWTSTPTPPETVRSEFAVKVRGMNHGEPAAVLEDVERAREHHAEQLAYFEAACAKDYPNPGHLSERERPLYAVLRGGIRTERAMLEWCDEMLALFRPADPSRTPPRPDRPFTTSTSATAGRVVATVSVREDPGESA